MGKLLIVLGEDDFAAKNRARRLIEELAGEKFRDNDALEIIDGSGAGIPGKDAGNKVLSEFLSALRTPPFLLPEKIVWLKDFEFFDLLDDADPAGKAVMEILSAPLPDDLTILISGGKLDQRSSLVKNLKKFASAYENFPLPKSGDKNFDFDRRTVLDDLLKKNNKHIANDAVLFLLEAVGGSSGSWMNEIDKLITSVGDKERITLADAQEIISRTPEAVSWSFTAALIEKKRKSSLVLLNQLLDQGESPLGIIYAIAGEYQRLLQAKSAIRELGLGHVSPRTFDNPAYKEQFPNNPLVKMHPYRAFKTVENSLRFSDAELPAKIEEITRANIALVSSGGDPRIVLENLVIKLT